MRSYTRDGVWGWPLEAQRDKLRLAGHYEPDREYSDTLTVEQARKPSHIRPEWLTERTKFLRPTRGRKTGETVAVATLLALGVSEGDLVQALAVALTQRRDTVLAADSGFMIGPDGGPEMMARAVADWQRAKRDAQTKPGRLEGMRVAAQKRRAETMRKIQPAKAPWRDTKSTRMSADEIAEQFKLSTKTLYQELGRRPAIKKGKGNA